MNLSTHSISSHSARYSAKPAVVSPDSGAPADPNAEFAALFDDVTQRCDPEEAKDGASRTETRGNSRRAESPLSRPRARVDEEEKLSEQKPNENLISQLEAPRPQPADEVELELEDGEISEDPNTAIASEEEESALNDGVGDENVATVPFDAGGGEGFEMAQSSLEEAVPALAADADSDSEPEENTAEDTVVATEDLTGLTVARDLPQETKPKNVIPPEAVKRGPIKPLADANRRPADFADFESDAPVTGEKSAGGAAKNFLQDAVKEVTPRNDSLGINVAKVVSQMNHVASPHELAGLLSKQVAVDDVAGFSRFETQNPPAAQAVPLSGLHQAVNAAMEAGERMKSDGQRAVDLRFSFGSDDLSVRVELHEGRLRATFRTDSAELRGALAQEWQVLNTSSVDRTKRFADAVFAANSSTPSAGDHQEKHGGRNQDMHAPAEHFQISNSRGVSVPVSARPVASPLSPQTAAPLTALRLHTFA